MSRPAATLGSWWGPAVVCGLAVIALASSDGCASSNTSDGGPDSGVAGSGGSSGSGSGGTTGSASGGSNGSGGRANGSGGSSSAGSGGLQGSGGTTSASGGTGVGGSSSGSGGISPPHCNPTVTVTSPSSPSDIEVGTTVRVEATANEFPVNPSLTWSWMISDPVGQATVTTNPTGDDAVAVVEFSAAMPGTYQVMATAMGDPNCTVGRLSVVVNASQGPTFNFRVTASGYPIQDTRVKLANGLNGTFPLDAGLPFTIRPLNPSQGTLASTYVRISRPNQAFDFEGNTTSKPVTATLLPMQTYELLIAPVDSKFVFAPLLTSSIPGNWPSQGFTIDQGTKVSGQALTAGGAPLPNARMQLRSATGAPSTIGLTDTNGALTLQTRDGKMSALVVPPDGSGLPVATTADGSIVSANGASLSLSMQWAAMAQSTLTVQVRDADGTSAVANAQVRLVSSGVPYSAGTLTVQSSDAADIEVATVASVSDSLQTGDDGTVTFPPFPAGIYTVTIIPPATSAPGGVTTTPITLTAGTVMQTVALARKVTLMGILGSAGAGAQVTAIDVGNSCTGTSACSSGAPSAGTSTATGAVVSGQTTTGGTFSLSVDPDRTYQLIVQPASKVGTTMGRAVLPPFRVCSTVTAGCTATNSGQLGSVSLPAGTQYQGFVSSDNGAVAGAFVQVFCASASATCADTTVSVAEATTLGDGSFDVILPVPAGTPAALNK